MARNRDYKAEYARAKSRAQSAGYKSEREYKAVRKALSLPKNVSPVPKRILEREAPGQTKRAVERANRISRTRSENRRWSRAHSRVKNSEYNPRWSDDRAESYHRAYVDPMTERERMDALHDYLVDEYELVDEDEWESVYE